MNTEINELKTLTKHVYAHVNINLMVENVIPIKSGIMINVGKKCMSVKNILYMKTFSCKSGKYLASFTGNSVIMCDEIMDAEERKSIPKYKISETKSFYNLLTFLLITIALLTVFTIYFCLIM